MAQLFKVGGQYKLGAVRTGESPKGLWQMSKLLDPSRSKGGTTCFFDPPVNGLGEGDIIELAEFGVSLAKRKLKDANGNFITDPATGQQKWSDYQDATIQVYKFKVIASNGGFDSTGMVDTDGELPF